MNWIIINRLVFRFYMFTDFDYNFKVLVPLPVTIPQCRGLYDFDVEDENDKKDCLCFKKVTLLVELFLYLNVYNQSHKHMYMCVHYVLEKSYLPVFDS